MPLLTRNVNLTIHLTSSINGRETISTNSSTKILTTSPGHATSVSIPAIVGGTAAGIALAVAVLAAWKWWTSIIRQPNKKCHSRRVCFMRRNRATPDIPNGEGCSRSNGTGCSDGKKSLADSPPTTIGTTHHTTPVQHSLTMAAPSPEPPTKPPRNPARAMRRPSDHFKEGVTRGSRTSFVRASNRLSYKSTISTASMYSTQTSEEEQQVPVPAAIITAALGGTRHLSRPGHSYEHYTIGEEQAEQAELVIPCSRPQHSTDLAQLHRVSNISAGSLCLQQGVQSTDSIGVAYGGEES